MCAARSRASVTAPRIASGVAGTSYSDTSGLVSGTVYYYRVHAFDASNSQEDANTAERSGIPTGPNATSSLSENFETAGGFDPGLPGELGQVVVLRGIARDLQALVAVTAAVLRAADAARPRLVDLTGGAIGCSVLLILGFWGYFAATGHWVSWALVLTHVLGIIGVVFGVKANARARAERRQVMGEQASRDAEFTHPEAVAENQRRIRANRDPQTGEEQTAETV